MKLSISSGYLEARVGFDKAYKMIKEAGFDAVDFNLSVDLAWDEAEIRRVTGYGMSEGEFCEHFTKIYEGISARGLEVGQTHSLFGDRYYFNGKGDMYCDITKLNIHATHLLRSRYTVIHPIRTLGRLGDAEKKECHALNLEFYRSLIPTLERYDVISAIEPMWKRDADGNIRSSSCSHPDEILEFIDELGSDRFCACPDFGHFALTEADTGITVGNAIRKLGGNTKIIHAHEITTNIDAHTKPYTYGTMDWDDIANALREVGYAGNFNFEVGGGYLEPYPERLLPEALRHLAIIGESLIKTHIIK